MLAKAIAVAAAAHQYQTDKGGKPYILHCLTVMKNVHSEDEELMQIAVMHDLLEDTTFTERHLRDIGFSERVIEGVKALTKTKDQGENEYLIQVMRNKDAIKVKLADLRHNTDIRRLKGITPKDFERMMKYHRMYTTLKGLEQ